MRNAILAAALALAAFSGCSKSDPSAAPAAGAKTEKLAEMTIDEVDQAISSGQAKAVDCNMDTMRKKLGVLPGAITVSEDDSYAASELPADKTAKLIFYCADRA
ncbi:MAG TPA: hypothetical protein VH143_08805 [Kofleriaceae bacterium]|jgi:type IV pilus biogenesis protein CpaD/CtpE|nr:hypothetical protein [Kofleriaceae bacterium]